MKRLSAAILIAILVSALVTAAQEEAPPDFRKARWGMTRAEVLALEGREITRDEGNAIVFKDSINNLECELFYYFVKGILTRAGYIVTERHTDYNLYLNDYQALKQLLTKKYGEPTKDRVTWRNDLFRDMPSAIGLAISMGHVFYQAAWETPSTEITLGLFGDKAKVTLMILYESKAHKELSEQAEEAETLEQL